MHKIKNLFLEKIYTVLIYPLVFFLLLGIVFYLYQIYSITNAQKRYAAEEFHKAIHVNIHEKTRSIEQKLSSIETSLYSIDLAIENYYNNSQHFNESQSLQFKINDRGFWYKPENLKGSGVIFTPQAKPNKQDFIDAFHFEKADPFIMPLIDKNDIVVAGWMNLENYMVRYYPDFDMKNILEVDMDLKTFNFYYEANPKNNPNKQNIWTSPYLDPAMKGWLVSRVAPIYKQSEFLGVYGIDINIAKMVANVKESIDYLEDYEVFLTNEKGDFLSISNELKHMLGLEKLNSYKENKSISDEVLLPDSYNILNSKKENIKNQLQNIFTNKDVHELGHKSKKYYIFKSNISNTNWYLFYMINQDNLYKKLEEIQNHYLQVAAISILFLLIMFFLIVLNLKRKLDGTISSITEPIEELSEATKSIGSFHLHDDNNIEEIATLHHNFKDMAKRINAHNEELENKVEEATSELYKKIETIENLREKLVEQNHHDHLTNLFNRRYGDKALERETSKALLNNTPLTLAIIDLDNFKEVNDRLGHQIGDIVLQKLSSILQSYMKKRSIPIRYGGEEFLLVFPGFSKEEVYNILESIKEQYYDEISSILSIEAGKTFSAGIASLPEDAKNIEDVIRLADNALYFSKSHGRNKTIIHKA